MATLEADYAALIDRVRPAGWVLITHPKYDWCVTAFKFPADADAYKDRLRSCYHLPVDMRAVDELPRVNT